MSAAEPQSPLFQATQSWHHSDFLSAHPEAPVDIFLIYSEKSLKYLRVDQLNNRHFYLIPNTEVGTIYNGHHPSTNRSLAFLAPFSTGLIID